MLKFHPMPDSQGKCATLPDGRRVIDWDRPAQRYELQHRDGFTILTSDRLADVLPSTEEQASLRRLGQRLAKARQAEAEAMAAIKSTLPDAIRAGITEVDAAKITGLDRITIRKMLGKDPRRNKS